MQTGSQRTKGDVNYLLRSSRDNLYRISFWKKDDYIFNIFWYDYESSEGNQIKTPWTLDKKVWVFHADAQLTEPNWSRPFYKVRTGIFFHIPIFARPGSFWLPPFPGSKRRTRWSALQNRRWVEECSKYNFSKFGHPMVLRTNRKTCISVQQMFRSIRRLRQKMIISSQMKFFVRIF